MMEKWVVKVQTTFLKEEFIEMAFDFKCTDLKELDITMLLNGRQENLFGLVGFYGISTITGYLMPNTFYTHIY